MTTLQIQSNQIETYTALLTKWNNTYSLISPFALGQIKGHIKEAMLLSDFLKDEISVYDLGSGNGLPAVILSIALPKTKIYAIEVNEKKAVFLQNVKVNLALDNFSVINEKIENVNLEKQTLTAKAFASIEDTLNLLKNNKPNKLFLLKGKKLQEELLAAKQKFTFEYKVHNIKNSSLVEILY